MSMPQERAEQVKRAKDRLKLVSKVDKLIDNKLREIDRLKEIATSVSKPLLPNIPRTGNSDKIGTIITKTVDYQEDVTAQIDYYIDLKKDIVAEIEAIESEEAMQLLYYRYIDGKTWKEIEVDMSISRAWMFKLHAIALMEYGSRLK